MRRNKIIKNVLERKRIASGPDYRDMGAVLLLIFLLPYIVSFFFGNTEPGKSAEKLQGGTEETWEEDAGIYPETKIFEEDYKKAEFIVCNRTAAGTEKMPLETYLTCRLPATIDMDYEPETLKAQAVILRTELLKLYFDSMQDSKRKEEKDGKHYIYVESRLEVSDGGVYEKCKEAVRATKGMYMTYNGYPVKAPYFAVSAGATRNGNEVFGNEEYPYLKSVMCERDFTASEYAKTLKMDRSVFMARLKENYPEFEPGEGKIEDILTIEKDRAGYVLNVDINGWNISGEAFRSVFGLNSSCFTVEEENIIFGERIIIKSKGVGHGLGFGQYGANEAAKKGSDFIDILNYFFSDIVIEKTE